MKTLVLGASPNPERYSFKAVSLLRFYGHEVVAVGNREGEVAGVHIQKSIPAIEDLHTVTLYLNPTLQKQYYDSILALAPKRIIFNPGTENPELESLANDKNIETEEACTLVLLRTGGY